MVDEHFSTEGAARRIQATREAVERVRGNPADRASMVLYLAAQLFADFRDGQRRSELHEAIDLLREVITLAPRGRLVRRQAEFMLVLSLSMRIDPGDASEAIVLAERLLATAGPDSAETPKLAFALGGALLARQVDQAGTGDDISLDKLDRVIDRLDRVVRQTATAAAHTAIGEMNADLMRLGLAMCMAGRFQARASADPADVDRIRALLATLDEERLAAVLPGVEQVIQTIKAGLPTSLNILGEGGGDPRRMASGEELGTVVRPGPVRQFTTEMLGLADSIQRVTTVASLGYEGNLHAIDELVARNREDVAKEHAGGARRLLALVGLSQVLLMRFRTRRLAGMPDARRDLDEATRVTQQAMADPDGPGNSSVLAAFGRCLLDRYTEGLGTPADLDDALRYMERAVFREAPDARHALANRIILAEALMARGYRDGDLDDFDRALETLEVFQQRLPPGSAFRANTAVRIAIVLQHRSAALRETEELLQASLASRKATEDVAQVSVIWAYDSAWHWANWAWEHAPVAERAEAHLQALGWLYRLARAQLTRGAAETALRRQTQNLVARTVRAAVGAGRLAEAVVAAETGRAVMLSLVLQRRETELSTVADAGLRERFQRASERLAAAEVGVQ